jgi:hypothetical protein
MHESKKIVVQKQKKFCELMRKLSMYDSNLMLFSGVFNALLQCQLLKIFRNRCSDIIPKYNGTCSITE